MRIITEPGLKQEIDGWINDTNTWTFATASTFTIAGDQTAIFTKGTKLKYTQTTAKYAYVASSSYGAPNTTVTIMISSDYTLANAAITSPAYSYADNPQGFPGWFNFTPTYGGFIVNPSGAAIICKYKVSAKTVTYWYDDRYGTQGTSNATSFTVTLPVASSTAKLAGFVAVYDNGGWSNTIGKAMVAAGSATLTLMVNASEGGWTGSGTKTAETVAIYEF